MQKIKYGHEREFPIMPGWDTSLCFCLFHVPRLYSSVEYLLQEISFPYTYCVYFASYNILNSPCKKGPWIIDTEPGEKVQGEQREYYMTWYSNGVLQGDAWANSSLRNPVVWCSVHFQLIPGAFSLTVVLSASFQVLSISWYKSFYKLFKWEVQLCL